MPICKCEAKSFQPLVEGKAISMNGGIRISFMTIMDYQGKDGVVMCMTRMHYDWLSSIKRIISSHLGNDQNEDHPFRNSFTNVTCFLRKEVRKDWLETLYALLNVFKTKRSTLPIIINFSIQLNNYLQFMSWILNNCNDTKRTFRGLINASNTWWHFKGELSA